MTIEILTTGIEAIKKQQDYDIQQAKRANKFFPNAFNANLLYDNEILHNAIIQMLELIFNDKDEWIKHYIQELNFGEENYRLKVIGKNGKEIPLTTIQDLFNILTK